MSKKRIFLTLDIDNVETLMCGFATPIHQSTRWKKYQEEEIEYVVGATKETIHYLKSLNKSSLSSEAERRTVNAMAKGSNPLESEQ